MHNDMHNDMHNTKDGAWQQEIETELDRVRPSWTESDDIRPHYV